MGKKRSRPEPRDRRSPTDTVNNVTDSFFDELPIPSLPDSVPQRLEEALRARIEALLFQLREAKKARYARPFEIRLLREAQKAVLTASALNIADAEVAYAEFRRLVEELGYERTDVGFYKPYDPETG